MRNRADMLVRVQLKAVCRLLAGGGASECCLSGGRHLPEARKELQVGRKIEKED